jgi:hypothetical protein
MREVDRDENEEEEYDDGDSYLSVYTQHQKSNEISQTKVFRKAV